MELDLYDWAERTLLSLAEGQRTIDELVGRWDKKPEVFQQALRDLEEQFAAIPTGEDGFRLTILGSIYVDYHHPDSHANRIGALSEETGQELLRRLAQHSVPDRIPKRGVPLSAMTYLADPQAQYHYSYQTKTGIKYREQAMRDLWTAYGDLEAHGLVERRYPTDDCTRREDCFIHLTFDGLAKTRGTGRQTS